MGAMGVAFWIAVAMVVYVYAGYPCVIRALGSIRH